MALLYGKPIADRLLSRIRSEIKESGIIPRLAVILVGDDFESHKYVGLKEERAKEAGMAFEKHLFPGTATHEEIFEDIERLNNDESVHGIIVQLPLPDGFPTDEIISHIDPKKDVDGFHEETVKTFLLGNCDVCPVFPRAIVELIRETGTQFYGERAVAVVNSEIMGKVMAFALSLEGLQAEYVLSSEGRESIAKRTAAARVVVTACGIPDLLDASMLASDAIVIDGGNVHVDGKVRGDVKWEEVADHVAFLSPVPGGVGPVTVATLLARTADAALRKN